MGGPDSFGTPPSYHKTLSGDLGLIHRAHRGFAYQDFATGEDEGSCPWVSRVPKRRNPFTLHRFGVSHTGISRLAKMRGLTLWFPGCRNTETYSRKTTHLQSASGFRVPGFRDLRKRGVLPFGFPGAETPKPIHAKPAHLQSASGFRVPGFRDLRKRGVLPFGFPGAETPKPIHAKPAHLQSASGFRVPGFRDLRK
jgi:hypothetical protein